MMDKKVYIADNNYYNIDSQI